MHSLFGFGCYLILGAAGVEQWSPYEVVLRGPACQYEGNIPRRWGNISAQEMVRRFWLGTARGSYVGHGETYLHPEEILWWSKGGVLHGESLRRIAFLRRIIEEGPELRRAR